MNEQHRFFNNTIINLINTVINFVVAYAMTPVILGRLGNEQYGIWVFLGIFSITGYFSLLDFGLQGAAIKYIAEYYGKRDFENLSQIITTVIIFFFLIGVACGILLFLFNILFLPQAFHLPADQISLITNLVTVLAVSFIFQFPAFAFSAILEGIQRYDFLRGISLVITIVSNVILYLFLKSSSGLTFVFATSIVSAVILTISYMFVTRRLLPEISFSVRKVKKEIIKLLFGLSSKLFASKIVGLIFNNTDKIQIAIFLTVTVQTDYDIVNKLHIILLSILSIFNQAVLPAASSLEAKQDYENQRMLLLRSTKFAAAFVLPALLLLQIFPDHLLSAWVGEQYSHLAPLVRLYSLHIFLTMLVGVSSTMLVGIDKVGQVLKISIWAAVLNLVISTATVTYMGITGLILGTVISYMISSAMYIRITNKLFNIDPKRFVREIITPLLIPFIVTAIPLLVARPFLHSIRLPIWLAVSIACYMIFFIMLYFFGTSKDERQTIRMYLAALRHS